MSVPTPYSIDLAAFRGQAEERHYTLNDDFFAAIDDSQIDGGSLTATVIITPRAGDTYIVAMSIAGTVRVPCDRCLEPMEMSIEADDTLKVVMGEADDDDGEVVTIDAERGTIDMAWYLYELAVLQLPITHVHPEGQCNEAMTGLLGAMQVGDTDIEE